MCFVLDVQQDCIRLVQNDDVIYLRVPDQPRPPRSTTGRRHITFKAFLLATSAAAVFATASGVWAQAIHPVTGKLLSDDQTFTYCVLDQPPSIDPGLAEDVEGAHVSRNLF